MEKDVTARASKTFEKAIYVICMNDMIVESQKFGCFYQIFQILRRASSPR